MAKSGPAFRALIGKFLSFYTEQLFNPHWGGRIAFPPYETLSVGMVSYGLDKAAAQAVWQPFLDWIAAAPQDYRLAGKPTIADMPARKSWDAEFRKKYSADSIVSDPRPEANPRDFSFAGWPGFETLWLPAALLQRDRQQRLADALYAASRRFFSRSSSTKDWGARRMKRLQCRATPRPTRPR
jgi:hypothetical protein